MDSNLLKRYFENQCTPRERGEVSDWLADEGNRQEATRLMEGMWNDYVDTRQKIKPLHRRKRTIRRAVAAVVAGVLVSVAAMLLVSRWTPGGEHVLSGLDGAPHENVFPAAPVPGSPQTVGDGGKSTAADLSADPPSGQPSGAGSTKGAPAAAPLSVKAQALGKAQLVNEQRFLDLLAGLDSTALTDLFTYRHTHLQEIFGDIQKKYNLEITVCDDSLNRMIVNKNFDAVNLRELLFQIRKEMDLTYAVQGNRILICFNREK